MAFGWKSTVCLIIGRSEYSFLCSVKNVTKQNPANTLSYISYHSLKRYLSSPLRKEYTKYRKRQAIQPIILIAKTSSIPFHSDTVWTINRINPPTWSFLQSMPIGDPSYQYSERKINQCLNCLNSGQPGSLCYCVVQTHEWQWLECHFLVL